jgi:signal transduction histidine kinase
MTDDDPHFGLRLLRTRVHEIDGSIEIESTPGRGVRVIAVLPVGGQGESR